MSKRATPQNYVQQLRLRSPVSSQVYLSILNGFQRFVAEQAEGNRYRRKQYGSGSGIESGCGRSTWSRIVRVLSTVFWTGG